jgi:hypothetical protein
VVGAVAKGERMRIALIADSHGNLIACATVLQGVTRNAIVFVNDTRALPQLWYSAVESQEIATRDLIATNVLCLQERKNKDGPSFLSSASHSLNC